MNFWEDAIATKKIYTDKDVILKFCKLLKSNRSNNEIAYVSNFLIKDIFTIPDVILDHFRYSKSKVAHYMSFVILMNHQDKEIRKNFLNTFKIKEIKLAGTQYFNDVSYSVHDICIELGTLLNINNEEFNIDVIQKLGSHLSDPKISKVLSPILDKHILNALSYASETYLSICASFLSKRFMVKSFTTLDIFPEFQEKLIPRAPSTVVNFIINNPKFYNGPILETALSKL